jgi:rare lipoprotein A (peptidoglycan hydrolase)
LKFPNRDLDLAQAAAARMGMLRAGVKYLKWRKITNAAK